MKKLNFIIIIILALTSIQCKSQTPIISINGSGEIIPNSYYKDIDNQLNPFIGTWVWNDGTNYLKIVFQKKVMALTGNYYQDLLIGEFQYKENGIELVNTLQKLIEPLPNVYHHSIDGNLIMTNQTPFDDYTTDNFRVSLVFGEPNGIGGELDVRITTVNGQEAIQIFKRSGIITREPGEPVLNPIIPNGFYYLIRQ